MLFGIAGAAPVVPGNSGKYPPKTFKVVYRSSKMTIRQQAFQTLKNLYPRLPAQGPVGYAPDSFLRKAAINTTQIVGFRLSQPLDRSKVRSICTNPNIPALDAYCVAMAWGGQRRNHFRNSITADNLVPFLDQLRNYHPASRAGGFNLAKGHAQTINGLGISFYTKLLYFFLPEPTSYILDKWTALSVSALFEDSPIGLMNTNWHPVNALPHPQTSGHQYQRYCEYLDALALEMEQVNPLGWTGETMEMAIFDRPDGAWRDSVIKFHESHLKVGRHSHT